MIVQFIFAGTSPTTSLDSMNHRRPSSTRFNININIRNESNRLELDSRANIYIYIPIADISSLYHSGRLLLSFSGAFKRSSECSVFWLGTTTVVRKFASPFWRDSQDRTNRACNPPLVTLRPVTLLYKRDQRWNDVCKIQIEIRRGRSAIARHPQRNPPPGRKYDFLVSSSYFFAVASRAACGTQ